MEKKLGIYVCVFCRLPVKTDAKGLAEGHKVATAVVGYGTTLQLRGCDGEGRKANFMPLIAEIQPRKKQK